MTGRRPTTRWGAHAALAVANVGMTVLVSSVIAFDSSCFSLWSRLLLGLAFSWLAWQPATMLTIAACLAVATGLAHAAPGATLAWFIAALSCGAVLGSVVTSIALRSGYYAMVGRYFARVSPVDVSRFGLSIALIVMGLALALSAHHDWLVPKRGAPHFASIDLAQAGIVLAPGRSYCNRRGFTREYVWETTVPEADMQQLVNALALEGWTGAGWAGSSWSAESFPPRMFASPAHWWRPEITTATRTFSTQPFPYGTPLQGLHSLAAWNPSSARLYLWQGYGDDGPL